IPTASSARRPLMPSVACIDGRSHSATIGAMTLGLVCESCDSLCALNATTCQVCGAQLNVARGAPVAAAAPEPPATRRCPTCAAEVAAHHRFCGSCGSPMPEAAAARTESSGARPKPGPKTMFFGAMQAPGRAKLILIKGEGMDGVSYV